MEKNSRSFAIRFEGPALDDHTMDVAQLAPALLAVNDALVELNSAVNKDDAKVRLKVSADFKPGSFIINLTLDVGLLTQIQDFLLSPATTATCNAFTLIEAFIEILGLKKFLEGYKPDAVNWNEDKSKATIVFNNNTMIVNNYTYYGYKNIKCREACSRIADPLCQEGIDAISVATEQREFRLEKADLDSFQRPEESLEINSHVNEAALLIETASFKDGGKWKVSLGEKNSIFASIEDTEFLARIDEGKERFGKGDVLIVDLETKQMVEGGKLVIRYSILKVKQHKPGVEQLELL
ncbi:hypothetical protein MUN46_011565 [Mesosutterella sp. AGMB02718]|uniref:Uncharacterized protein n=1 Tax=Mesosutterella faecium TaxID=2925194 RepID=A0ABT7ISS3_9BURK|nr:hypothetical protein [Mesosutterella sp. AGMB02718]MDL2060351.1 hypothetical protein [Mesosutterella sp. AGMB02718]MDL2060574.1 hypothetical protein [Mesosutterella sp. AGMB02718]